MAESLYGMLSEMLLDTETVQMATKKAREKIRKDYDKKVRHGMVQYYLDQYSPTRYKRKIPTPILSAYKTRSKLIENGTVVHLWVERKGIDISSEYNEKKYRSKSFYHGYGDDDEDEDINDDAANDISGEGEEDSKWKIMSDIHSITGRQYMLNIDDFHKQFGSSNGTVDGSWILSNFEAGIHPRTNGWPKKKGVRKMIYRPKKDPRTPLQMADEYSQEFMDLDTPYQYIYSEMFKAWQSKF